MINGGKGNGEWEMGNGSYRRKRYSIFVIRGGIAQRLPEFYHQGTKARDAVVHDPQSTKGRRSRMARKREDGTRGGTVREGQ